MPRLERAKKQTTVTPEAPKEDEQPSGGPGHDTSDTPDGTGKVETVDKGHVPAPVENGKPDTKVPEPKPSVGEGERLGRGGGGGGGAEGVGKATQRDAEKKSVEEGKSDNPAEEEGVGPVRKKPERKRTGPYKKVVYYRERRYAPVKRRRRDPTPESESESESESASESGSETSDIESEDELEPGVPPVKRQPFTFV